MSVKHRDHGSAIDDLRMSGCLKLLFSRRRDRVESVILNSSGGLTSGDRITLQAEVQEKATLSLTTQAAERAYRADQCPAHVSTQLTTGDQSTLFWLPQELILFDGAQLHRKLTCDLAQTSRALLVEPVIFGRHAMGEHLRDVDFQDEIKVTRNGTPLFRDMIHLQGDVHTHMSRPVRGAGMGAMVTLLYVAPDAEAKRDPLRPALPATGGATLLSDDTLLIRALAPDGLELRRFLVPLLDRLTQNSLPVCWRL